MAGGVPMNGPMQFPPGMQGRMMPAMAPPQMMQPGQGGMPAGWQGGSMNNQPPNNAGVVAGSEGPADPMLMQQWQAHQAQAQQQQMMQHMMQMRITLEYLQQENKKLTAEKSQSFKMSDPNKDIRELEQKKETLGKEVMQLMAQKNQLEFMCNQLMQQHHMQAMMVVIKQNQFLDIKQNQFLNVLYSDYPRTLTFGKFFYAPGPLSFLSLSPPPFLPPSRRWVR